MTYTEEPVRPTWLDGLERVHRLTSREYEVFLLLVKGSSNQELADSLSLTERTVRAHLTQILQKLELGSRLEACLLSYAHSSRLHA
ncbi:response regulator transcription factor [Allokutzneria oryzae]|uniref:Response regulator transcription factor n=1 Tax=Allokutzneria oryzae TaxID=1378989 RepID=A0ABV5ZSK3_9PSEU